MKAKLMQNFRDNDTGKMYYEPVKLNLYNFIKRFSAWIRIWIWGFCPACNSDAPNLYDCKVCKWDTNSPFDRAKKKEYWNNWKLQNFLENL